MYLNAIGCVNIFLGSDININTFRKNTLNIVGIHLYICVLFLYVGRDIVYINNRVYILLLCFFYRTLFLTVTYTYVGQSHKPKIQLMDIHHTHVYSISINE